MTADPESLNRWLASQTHSKEPFDIVHTGEHDLVDDLKSGLADGCLVPDADSYLLDQRDNLANSPIKPAALIDLARTYAISGAVTHAKAAYENFPNLWKDADSDIPVLQRANEEYAHLH